MKMNGGKGNYKIFYEFTIKFKIILYDKLVNMQRRLKVSQKQELYFFALKVPHKPL